MHYIQKKILDALRINDAMHYADLQPKDIESSHFKYHLNQLIKDGSVIKKERGIYCLTESGQSYVDKLSLSSINPRNMPKVITYTIIKFGNDYVLYKKDKDPYKNLLNNVGGKVHTGESITEASEREVYEKLGIHIKSEVLGSVNIRIKKSGRFFTHAIASICSTSIDRAPESKQAVICNHQEILESNNLAPDLKAILELAVGKSLNFSELDIEM